MLQLLLISQSIHQRVWLREELADNVTVDAIKQLQEIVWLREELADNVLIFFIGFFCMYSSGSARS